MPRKFQYVGEPTLTRGDDGDSVVVGYSHPDDGQALAVWDSDYGWRLWSSIDAALRSGDWIEIHA